MSLQLIAQKTNPIGGFYLARQDDGVFLAGRQASTALAFATAQLVYYAFRPLADEGQHWAWNICYAIEDFIE